MLGLAEAERRARARGHATIEMYVDDDNARAKELYLRNGYFVVGPYLDSRDEALPDGSSIRIETPGWLLHKSL